MTLVSLLLIIAGMMMAGCTPTQQGAGIGAPTGAIVGGVATNNARGAAVGPDTNALQNKTRDRAYHRYQALSAQTQKSPLARRGSRSSYAGIGCGGGI